MYRCVNLPWKGILTRNTCFPWNACFPRNTCIPWDTCFPFIRKFAAFCVLALCMAVTVPASVQAARLQDTGEKLVIVIDPGHGGDNLGTTQNGHEEKNMTLATAKAMYDELLLYEGIEVYLTRTGDQSLSLKERAEIAASLDADFLFSIHYNASETHESFGSEAWVSMQAPYNAYGYQFGCEFLKNMREMGLLARGVKTRMGDRGDYYGIIRESVALDIPAMILEHCHVDEERDEGYCSDDGKLAAFGKADADAVAKYFGLKSSALGVDYSGYELAEADEDEIAPLTAQDQTPPDVCQIELAKADYDAGLLTLSVSAADYDSTLLYYSYSLDGGSTFGPRQAWPESDTLAGSYADTFTLELDIPSGMTPQVVLRAYNMYDFYSTSNSYNSAQAFFHNKPREDGAAGTNAASLSGNLAGEPGNGTAGDNMEYKYSTEYNSSTENKYSVEETEEKTVSEQVNGENRAEQAIPVDAAIEAAPVKSELHLANLILACLFSVVLLSLLIFTAQSLIGLSRRRRRH